MTGSLNDLFEKCGECRGVYFDENKVCSLAVSGDKRAILCKVEFPDIVPREELHRMEACIKSAYNLSRAKVIPVYSCGMSEAYLASLKEYIQTEYPSVNGYLKDSVWAVRENQLKITVPQAGMDYVKLPVQNLGDVIRREVGMEVAVELSAAQGLDAAFEETQTQREETLLQIARQTPALPGKPAKKSPARTASGSFRKEHPQKRDENTLYGKFYDSPVLPIQEALQEFGRVTIRGDIFYCETREIKNKDLVVFFFDITDQTSSIRVKKVLNTEKAKELIEHVKTGMYVTVQGKLSFDSWEKETMLEPLGIIKSEKKCRMDTAEEKRVELHLHTVMSSMDGMNTIGDYAKAASSWGHRAIAITDHGVAQGYPDAMKAAEKYSLKMLYGVEAYYVNDGASSDVVRGDTEQSLDGEFVVFDLETTGLNPGMEGITEIAATAVKNGEIMDSFQTYVNPRKHIPANITELTGITDDMVSAAPEIGDALPAFLQFCKGRILVAHNAGFDMSFLQAACAACKTEASFTYIDTLEMARILLPDLNRHKLNVLAKELKVGKFDHHRASEDALVLAKIFIRLCSMMKEIGIDTVSKINPVLGARKKKEIHIKNYKRHHMLILVKNKTGLENLYRLISYSHLNYYYMRPVIPRSLLLQYREGLIIGSACEAGELFRAVVDGKPFEELLKIAEFYDFLEIQPIGNNAYMLAKGMAQDEEQLRDFNRTILQLGDALHKMVCATGDVHFLQPQDEVFRRILMAGQGFPDADNQPPLYLKTTDEMLEEFSYLGEDRAYEVVVKNTNAVADMCEEIRPVPKESFPPTIEGDAEDLERMSREKAKRLYGEPLPELVKTRMERELHSIISNGYAVMYIIAQKLVTKSVQDGYLVGSRGSVGSSFVAFLSDITEVNSLAPHYLCPACKYVEFHENEGFGCGVDMEDKLCPNCGGKLRKEGFSIPFETFMGFKGDKTPDIDLNFSGEYQAEAHKYTGVIFGEDHVFRAGTIGTIAEKTAYGFVKKYLESKGATCSRAEENRLTAGCTGIKRTTGQHPGGVMVVPRANTIFQFCPIQHPADDPNSDIITTHFDYHSIHDNLLKLDLLGHDDPTIIRHLEDLTGLSAREIPLDDPETMSLFTSNKALKFLEEGEDKILGPTGAVAVPEFGTKFVRGMLLDTMPTSFEELVSISGLSHGTDVWLGNAQELIHSGTATLKDCICCRDDIMNYLMSKDMDPSLAFTIMEAVRKGKGLKPEWEDTMREHQVPEWYIASCKKIKYMFPKAHAVAYVMMAFRIAWFKVHQPMAFYSAYFSIRAKAFDASCMILGDGVVLEKYAELQTKDRDKTISSVEKEMMTTLEVVHEFYRRGFAFAPMDIYASDATRFLIRDNALIPPFTSMPGIGEQAAMSIVAERSRGKFLSVEDLTMRCPKVSKSVAELLQNIGALGDLPKSTQVTFF